MKKTLVYIIIVFFQLLPGFTFGQFDTKVFAGTEGGNLSLPSSKSYYLSSLGENYVAYQVGFGIIKPLFKSGNKEVAVVSNTYFKSYYTDKITLSHGIDESAKVHANYIGLSAGIELKISRLVIDVQPFAAYMIYNKEVITLEDGSKQNVTLSNKGPYAINYFNYGVLVSTGFVFPLDKPKFGVRLSYPLSFKKLYDNARNDEFSYNRWLSVGQLQLEYYF